MPRNFKESLFFTGLMCVMMVLGMTTWNLIVAGHFSWGHLASSYRPGFIVALFLDIVLAGPIAKKLAFAILERIDYQGKKWVRIIAVSGMMVLFMVSCMSLYGLLFNRIPISYGIYGRTWITNFVFALPLNLLVVGPIARFILGNLQRRVLNLSK